MNEEKTQPQLMVLKDGVFRPAEITIGPGFVKTIEDTIAAESLQLVSSAYLGDRRYIEWTGKSTSELDEMRKAEMRLGAVNHAARLAKELGVPYFSVSFTVTEVEPPIDLDKPPLSDFDKYVNERKVEYALHPTAQFYIRKGESK